LQQRATDPTLKYQKLEGGAGPLILLHQASKFLTYPFLRSLNAANSYFYSFRYYDYISPYGTLLRNPQPLWRLGLLLSVVLPRIRPRPRALPILFTGIPDALVEFEPLGRETRNCLHAVAFTISGRFLGRPARKR
jgi:hypothetical protein